MRRFMLSAAVVAATVLGLLAPAITVQAATTPITLSPAPNFAISAAPGSPTPPLFCVVTGAIAEVTVSGIKGNPHNKHDTYQLDIIGTQGASVQQVAGPVPVTSANALLVPLDITAAAQFSNDGVPVTFTDRLFNSAGTLVASISATEPGVC
jgi:hypothetical protein